MSKMICKVAPSCWVCLSIVQGVVHGLVFCLLIFLQIIGSLRTFFIVQPRFGPVVYHELEKARSRDGMDIEELSSKVQALCNAMWDEVDNSLPQLSASEALLENLAKLMQLKLSVVTKTNVPTAADVEPFDVDRYMASCMEQLKRDAPETRFVVWTDSAAAS